MENNNKESFTLLGMSESGSDSASIPEIVAPRKKKVRRRVRGSSGHRVRYREPCTCNARTVGLSLAATLLLCWLIVLSWLAVVLHNELKRLDFNVNNVVAGSQGVTDALQKYHSLSRELQQNQTLLLAKLEVLETKIANISTQVTPMQYSLRELQDKLKAAPELVNVPRNLEELKGNVANFGSQIRDFNTTVTDLKIQNGQLQELSKMLVNNITSTEKTVAMLLNASEQSHGTAAENGEETKALLAITSQLSQNITRVNDTLNSTFQWIIEDQRRDHKTLEGLQELGQNVSAKITTLEGECTKSSAQAALLQQVGNVTNRVTSSEVQLHELSNNFQLLLSNNSQLLEEVNSMRKAIFQLNSKILSNSQMTPGGATP